MLIIHCVMHVRIRIKAKTLSIYDLDVGPKPMFYIIIEYCCPVS